MKTSSLVVAITALLLTASVGFSATKAQQKQFATGDKNGDKTLSKEEWVSIKLVNAEKIAEKNKKDFDEAKSSKQATKSFAKADTDGNGEVSSDEFFASFPAKKNK
jgi:Ca2+-binding EF-hand superfamily protein